jgi:spore germination protein GerM
MSLPVSDQHAPVGRENILAPESETKFPHTVVSGVDSCAMLRYWKRKEYFLSGAVPSVRRIQYSDDTQIARSLPSLLMTMKVMIL